MSKAIFGMLLKYWQTNIYVKCRFWNIYGSAHDSRKLKTVKCYRGWIWCWLNDTYEWESVDFTFESLPCTLMMKTIYNFLSEDYGPRLYLRQIWWQKLAVINIRWPPLPTFSGHLGRYFVGRVFIQYDPILTQFQKKY